MKDGTKYTMDSFKKLMLDYGYRFSMNGTIFINGDDKALLVLDKNCWKNLDIIAECMKQINLMLLHLKKPSC